VVSTYADMALGNLTISFDDPNAFLIWEDDWFGTVTAYAQDTDSGGADDYDEYLGNDGAIEAEAQTAHVFSQATYEVVDGQNVAVEPDAGVAATTVSRLDLVGKRKQAYGFAASDFDNFFSISSTAPLGPTVATTIALDYAGDLDAFADDHGFFSIFTGAYMELYDVDDVLGDVIDPALAFDLVFDEAAGTATSYANTITGTLSITYDIPYDDVHWLYAQADSEVYGAVPVAGTLSLLLFGAAAVGFRRRRSRHNRN
jgi:hypothetical protein